MREVFKNLFRKCSIVEKRSKHNNFTMNGIVGMGKEDFLQYF